MKRDYEQMFAEASARFDRQRARGVELYGWNPACLCHMCGDTGIVPDTQKPCVVCDEGKRVSWMRERDAAWRSDREIAHHRDCKIDTHPSPDAQEIGHEWLENGYGKLGGLLLLGNTGTGKTGLAVALGYELHMRGVVVMFTGASRMLDELRPGVNRDPAAQMRNVLNTGLLIIDDLGAEKLTEFTAERIYAIVDGRYTANVPTIITTNLDLEKLQAQVGDRVMSRMAETFAIRKIGGPDIRKQRLAGVA